MEQLLNNPLTHLLQSIFPLWFVFGGVVGLGVQLLVCKIAEQRQLVSLPNARSSHALPTPTAGGLGFVLVIGGFLFFGVQDNLASWWGFACLGVAVVGFWDDIFEVSAKSRLFVQFVAAGCVLYSLYFFGASLPNPAGADVSGFTLGGSVSVLFWLILLVGSVWFINLFNFMDGIDGIAACQALTYCLALQVVGGLLPGWFGHLVWLVCGSLVAFLAFNWAPAKIFMGDVGSNFLGLLIAALAIYAWQIDKVPMSVSLILLASFWFDATYTLIVRIMTRQNITQAHRSHLYQRLTDWVDKRLVEKTDAAEIQSAQGADQDSVQQLDDQQLQKWLGPQQLAKRAHMWVTMGYVVFICIWLVPLAICTNLGVLSAWIGLLAAILPIGILCRKFRVGTVLVRA